MVLRCSPLGAINDKRQFVQSRPGSVRCILSGKMLRLDITLGTMKTNNVLRSFLLLVNVVLKV